MPPTTNHVQCPNIPGTNLWRYVWTLTRALKKAGWKYKGSSNGTLTDVSSDPENDYWGSGQLSAGGPGPTAVILAPARGRARVTGLVGITSSDKGRFLHLDGSIDANNNHFHQIEEVLSATDVMIDARTFPVTADATGLTWDIRDAVALLDTEWTTFGSVVTALKAWWAAEGPTIIKIPITAAATVGPYNQEFVRGENVRQAVTGFQGEIIGYIWWTDGVTTIGYLVINPRVRGTGAGVYGLSAGTDAITGDVSGASVAGANVDIAIAYTEEIVVYKADNDSQGKVFSGFFNQATEDGVRFCGAAQLAGATATVAPGSSSGLIGFPDHGAVVHGPDPTSGTWYPWGSNSNYGTMIANRGYGFAIAADCIEEEGWSQDGSWVWAYSIGRDYTSCEGAAFQRCNDTEAGDVHPFVYINKHQGTMYQDLRTNPPGPADVNWYTLFGELARDSYTNCVFGTSANYTYSASGWMGYSTTREAWGDFGYGVVNALDASYNAGRGMILQNGLAGGSFTNPERSWTQPPYGEVRTKDTIWVVRNSGASRFRKGTLRWMFAVQGGVRFDMLDDGRFLQMGIGSHQLISYAHTLFPAICAGPWNGTAQWVL